MNFDQILEILEKREPDSSDLREKEPDLREKSTRMRAERLQWGTGLNPGASP